jgi:hypothetical protein
MAETPVVEIDFSRPLGADCARRVVTGLPGPLPDVGNDFDWQVRDYDSFRLFMLEELAARVPERKRWTPADLEVVLVEALASVLDQLSDMLDRVTAETWLETARRPESVRRLLRVIGYDAERVALAQGHIQQDKRDGPAELRRKLEEMWAANPWRMEEARLAGPRELHTQHRMVTLEDHGRLLEEHPLVQHAQASLGWGGAWAVVRVAIICRDGRPLDDMRTMDDVSTALRDKVTAFHIARGLRELVWDQPLSFRSVLSSYLERYRMVGQEVLMRDAVPVGIFLGLTIRVAPDYFQSEVRSAVEQALGRGPGGFFEPGRLRFGEDVNASDLIQALTALEGVETVQLDRFMRERAGTQDQTRLGRIVLQGTELATCDNDPARPERGSFELRMQGGRRG